jgi:enoyl ACP reductase
MTVLAGKRIVVTGVLNQWSIAYSVAAMAQKEGAEVVLTSFGRAMKTTRRAAAGLPSPVEVLELDVTNQGHADRLAAQLAEAGPIHGVLHAVAFAPLTCFGDDFMAAEWPDVATAIHVSAYSLKVLAEVARQAMGPGGGSIVSLDFDARVAWPVYNWMGVAKSALEATARYLARDLGDRNIRVNLVCAGPLRTFAARSIPRYRDFERFWDLRAPLGWCASNHDAVARACVALMSDFFPATTGEMVHVDGGAHALGAGDELETVLAKEAAQ